MNTFGTATLTTPRPKKQRGRVFDCGKYGKLRAPEIAKVAGISREGAWQRIQSGLSGEELCAPKYDGLRKSKERCSKPVVLVAVKLVRAFPHKVPTLKEIQKAHPMCKRNAMRWRQALTDANGAAR